MKTFLPAFGVFSYITLFALFIANAENWLGDVRPPLGPMLLLTLFSVSVCVCGLIYLTRPFLIFYQDHKPKEAIYQLIQQTFWLFGFAVIVAVILFLNK